MAHWNWIRSLLPFPTSTTSVPVPMMAKWELVLLDLKVLSRSLQLVCQSEMMQLAILCCGDFNLFFRSILWQDPVSSTLCFGGKWLQACVAWGVPPADVLSAVARSRCKQRVVFAVFKSLCGNDVCRCPFLLLPFQCISQTPVDDEQSEEEDDQRSLQCNFIFFMSSCVKLFFHCTTNYFPWYESDMRHLFGVFLKNQARAPL